MDMGKLVFAFSLITTPPEIPEPNMYDEFADAIRQVAVEEEVLDEREIRYVLARAEDWDNDLALIRRRYQELKNAPKLADAHRFPDRATVNELLAFNRAYRRHIDKRIALELDRIVPLKETLKEIDFLYQVWDAVRDSRCEYYYVTVRRQALKRLRDSIGKDDYMAGTLPPHVPVWRFTVTSPNE